MPRGGARPGAGRKPSKPKAETPSRVDKDGFKTDPSWPFGKERPAVEPLPAPPEQDVTNTSPLDYLLQVMRDQNEDKGRRMQAAIQAAPYMHAKKGEAGKKEQKDAAAKKVASKFTAGAPPKLVAAGGKKV